MAPDTQIARFANAYIMSFDLQPRLPFGRFSFLRPAFHLSSPGNSGSISFRFRIGTDPRLIKLPSRRSISEFM
jgi:hypothetical protein